MNKKFDKITQKPQQLPCFLAIKSQHKKMINDISTRAHEESAQALYYTL
jgi:hypothetical protein